MSTYCISIPSPQLTRIISITEIIIFAVFVVGEDVMSKVPPIEDSFSSAEDTVVMHHTCGLLNQSVCHVTKLGFESVIASVGATQKFKALFRLT